MTTTLTSLPTELPAAPSARGAAAVAGRGLDARPARGRDRTRPGGRLTSYGPVPTTARPRGRAAAPTPAQVRTRVGTAVSVLALVAALLVVGVSQLLAPGTAGVPGATSVVRVQPGDTLSGIAERQVPGVPARDVVERIVELNGLASPALRPGQTLTVPALAATVR